MANSTKAVIGTKQLKIKIEHNSFSHYCKLNGVLDIYILNTIL